MKFPAAFVDQVKSGTDIVAVIGRDIRLTQRNGKFWGLSPFVEEKTESFEVRPEERDFHCFSTSKHGDVFDWMRFKHGYSFRDAVEDLAKAAGLALPAEAVTTPSPDTRKRNAALAAAAFCADLFRVRLDAPEGEGARTYLAHRGIGDDLVNRFNIGFCPKDEDVLAAAKAAGHSLESVLDAGVLRRDPRSGRIQHIFSGRSVLPIRDRRGRTIAFAGRILNQAEGQSLTRMGDASRMKAPVKYINSPRTPLFEKSGVLYGLDTVVRGARSVFPDHMILVEGYFDAISLQALGIPAVATMGTAVTDQQLDQAWLGADRVISCLDGNEAGRKAAERVLELALPMLSGNRQLFFATLPEGEDPDLVARRSGEAIVTVLSASQPLSDRFLTPLRAARRVEERVTALNQARKRLDKLTDPDWRDCMKSALQEADLVHRANLDRLSHGMAGSSMPEPTLSSFARLRIRNRLQDAIVILCAGLDFEDLKRVISMIPPLDPAYEVILKEIVADPGRYSPGEIDLIVPHPGLDAASLLSQVRPYKNQDRNQGRNQDSRGRKGALDDLIQLGEKLKELAQGE